MTLRSVAKPLLVVIGLALTGNSLAAQDPLPPPAGQAQVPPARGQRGGGRPAAALTIDNMQIQQLLDAFETQRAQRALQLTDPQFAAFLPKLLALQNLRRQHRVHRNRLLMDLRGVVNPKDGEAADDAVVTTKIKALDDGEVRMLQDEQQAIGAIDQVLTVRQRAHFRIFEERFETEKINLLVQARGSPAPIKQPDSIKKH